MKEATTRLENLAPISSAEWDELTRRVDEHLLETLADLAPEEWDKPTECKPWKVRDVVAHIVAWDEATASQREFLRQTWHGYRRRKDHDGNPLDAQNQFQVDERATDSPTKLLQDLRAVTPKFHRAKRRLATVGRAVPFRQNFSGSWVTLNFAVTTIIGRDHFMHHVDICEATGRPFEPNSAEVRIAHDAIREWAERADAQVTLELSGRAAGTFVRGSGTTTIAADGIDFCRVISGRECSDLTIEGDQGAAAGWLATRAIF